MTAHIDIEYYINYNYKNATESRNNNPNGITVLCITTTTTKEPKHSTRTFLGPIKPTHAEALSWIRNDIEIKREIAINISFAITDKTKEYNILLEKDKERTKEQPENNTYQRRIKQTILNYGRGSEIPIDIYDILKAWNVTCPAIQNAIIRLLQPGQRNDSKNTTTQDLQEAITLIKRAIQLLDSK